MVLRWQHIVKILLNKGANPNARCGFYETALIAAIHEGHKDVIELLMSHGAEVEVVGSSFESSLDYASRLMYQPKQFDEEEK